MGAFYKVEVHTAEAGWAGHDGDIYVVLRGKNKNGERVSTSRHVLRGPFLRPSQADTHPRIIPFTDVDLQTIEIARLGLHNDLGGGWLCQKLIVRNNDRDTNWEFPCNEWLDADEFPYRTEIVLSSDGPVA